jgi:hypothetical protein
MQYKLGYVFNGQRARLKFYHYANLRALPPPPEETTNDLASVAPNQMFGNGPDPLNPKGAPDGAGLCTIADLANAIKLNTAMGAGEVVIPTPEVFSLYEKLSGYVPGNDSTDTGLSLSQAAEGARTIGLGGHKLHAYLDLPIGDVAMMKQSIYLFHGASIGVRLPKSAMDVVEQGKVWSRIDDHRILGDHDMFVVDYLKGGLIKLKTWKTDQLATWDWLAYYAMEQQARLYEDAAGADWNDANGFNMSQLEVDLTAIG